MGKFFKLLVLIFFMFSVGGVAAADVYNEAALASSDDHIANVYYGMVRLVGESHYLGGGRNN